MLPGVGLGRWPMPCALANGLLPGRGPAGRWPMPCALENGLLPGRGAPAAPPGRGAPGAAASPEGWAGRSGPRERRRRERMPRVRAPPVRAPEQPLQPEPARERPARGPESPRTGAEHPDVRRPGVPRWGRGARSRSGGRSGRGLACAVCLEGSAELPSHGGLDRGRGALDEFAELLELCKSDLAVYTEFGSDLVYAWFGSHNSPVWVGLPRQGRPQSRTGLISSRSLCFHSRSAVSRRSAYPEDLTHAMPARKRGAGVRHPRIRASRAPTHPVPASRPARRRRGGNRRPRLAGAWTGGHARGIRRTFVQVPCYTPGLSARLPRVSSPGRCRAGCRSSRR